MVSWARIACLPFIWYFLADEQYVPGLTLFVIAALTDALDGALARTRSQVTEAGKILDAVADRGLITLVALIFIPRYFGLTLLGLLILSELLNGVAAYRSKKKIGINPGANWAGKVKMILQCVAFGLLFLGILEESASLMSSAYFLLIVSLLFAFAQMFSYPNTLEEVPQNER
jgi:phosphatidylglycerophosphate synthase